MTPEHDASAAGDLLFTGRRVTAREALTLGLVNQVADGEDVALADTAIARCATSSELIEGASAFLGKRPPAFTGH